MTDEELLELIDECRKRGVTQLRLKNDQVGEVEFSLAPSATSIPAEDPFAAALTAPRKIDPTKCLNCQAAAPDRGSLCRSCHLGRAGVQS